MEKEWKSGDLVVITKDLSHHGLEVGTVATLINDELGGDKLDSWKIHVADKCVTGHTIVRHIFQEEAVLASSYYVEKQSVERDSLLDDIAVRAMQGLCANKGNFTNPDDIASEAYKIAQAMLNESKRIKEK